MLPPRAPRARRGCPGTPRARRRGRAAWPSRAPARAARPGRAPPAAPSRPPRRSRPRRSSGRKQFSPGRQNERLPMQSGQTTTRADRHRLERGQVEALLRVRDEHASRARGPSARSSSARGIRWSTQLDASGLRGCSRAATRAPSSGCLLAATSTSMSRAGAPRHARRRRPRRSRSGIVNTGPRTRPVRVDRLGRPRGSRRSGSPCAAGSGGGSAGRSGRRAGRAGPG